MIFLNTTINAIILSYRNKLSLTGIIVLTINSFHITLTLHFHCNFSMGTILAGIS